MDQLSAAIVVSLLGGIVAGGVVYASGARQRLPNVRRALQVGSAVFVLAIAAQSAMDSAVEVEAGTVAVVKQFGRVITVFRPGLNFKIPFFQEIVVYRTQEIIYETRAEPSSGGPGEGIYLDEQVDTATSDGQQIDVRFTVRFRIDGGRATYILENLGTEKEMVDKVVKANARVRVRNILKRYEAAQLYSGDIETAEDAIAEQLRQDYKKEGIQLVFFGLRSIAFTEDYKNAVEEKQIQAERIKTKENEAQQALYEKQKSITESEARAESQRLERIGVAQGDAAATELQANAEAVAILLRAQAQADANRLLAESLTPEVIVWQAALNWNGQYPLVIGGDGQYILPGDLFTQPSDSAE